MTRRHLDMVGAGMLRGSFRKGPRRCQLGFAPLRTALLRASGVHHKVLLTPELACAAGSLRGSPTGLGAYEHDVCQAGTAFLGAGRCGRETTSQLRTSRSAA